jgi:hypothetical protein
MKAFGIGHLKNLEPKVSVQQYQCERPGGMFHVSIKQLVCCERIDHHITGDRRKGLLACARLQQLPCRGG